MRNYVFTSYGFVKYSFPPPDFPNSQTQYFVTGSEEATLSQMHDFVGLLDNNFRVDQFQPLGDLFWLLDKDNVLELITNSPTWYSFVGTNVATTENPRKSWSHGH